MATQSSINGQPQSGDETCARGERPQTQCRASRTHLHSCSLSLSVSWPGPTAHAGITGTSTSINMLRVPDPHAQWLSWQIRHKDPVITSEI